MKFVDFIVSFFQSFDFETALARVLPAIGTAIRSAFRGEKKNIPSPRPKRSLTILVHRHLCQATKTP